MMSLLKRAPKLVWIAVLLAIGLLALAACNGDDEEGPAATAAPAEEQTLDIAMILPIQFDKDELRVQADGRVTVVADNTETDIPHNFAVYSSREAAESGEDALGATDICTAPCEDSVTFDIPEPGEYFFRCDVHPGQMTGTFIVE